MSMPREEARGGTLRNRPFRETMNEAERNGGRGLRSYHLNRSCHMREIRI